MVMTARLLPRLAVLVACLPLHAQGDDASRASQTTINQSQAGREDAFTTITTIAWPERVVPEVSGILPMGDGRTLVCTRRGELWLVTERAGSAPEWSLWADGLLEPMGLARMPAYRLPAVWLPFDKAGRSPGNPM
jgi:hypothetical protein